MDKATYLKLKQERLESEQKFSRESFCYTCFKLSKHCLCSGIKSFDPGFEFVILIHPMEAKREKMGTGRITHAFLKNSKMISGVDFTNDPIVNDLIHNRNCFIMYPGESAINISSDVELPIQKLQSNPVIFLIDGTWPCAKKMMKLSKNLHQLPKISFNVEKESMFSIKEQPSKFCLSTLESIHLFLSECEKRQLINLHHQHDKMLDVFQSMIDFQIKCASDPSLSSYRKKASGYSKPTERTQSKKWEKRSIIFRGE